MKLTRVLVWCLMVLFLVLTPPTFAQGAPPFVLQGTIDLGDLGFNFATSIAFDPVSGNLFVAATSSEFAEITPDGTVVNTFSISVPGIPRLDNSGLSHDPTSGNLFFVNGLGVTEPEPIIEMATDGTIVNQFSSPVQEGTGLAIDLITGHLFVSDVGNSPPGLHLVRELKQQGSTFVQVSSFTLPTIFDFADAGLEFNPFTGNLAVAGTFGDNPGVIFDVSNEGTILGVFFDTGISNGIAGITFDIAKSTLYVVTAGVDNKIFIFAPTKVVEVPVDIKPGSCLNPLNVTSAEVLPVAILGTDDFDVLAVDPASIRLLGVTPLKSAFEDVATPFEPFIGKESEFDCTDEECPDGFLDLTLKFDTQEIVEALGDVEDGEVLVLTLEGELSDGTPIVGEDVVVILKKGKK